MLEPSNSKPTTNPVLKSCFMTTSLFCVLICNPDIFSVRILTLGYDHIDAGSRRVADTVVAFVDYRVGPAVALAAALGA